MIRDISSSATVLTVVSLASLTMISLICLWCRRKTKIIHEENQIYDPQTFQRGGSRFAVMRSKTVTRPNQITRQLPPTPPDSPILSTPTSVLDGQPKYENIHKAQTEIMEPTYVAPLPTLVYQNIDKTISPEVENSETNVDPCVYGNVFQPSPISITSNHSSDGDDYENSEFLVQVGTNDQEDDEPDYVNADNEPTA